MQKFKENMGPLGNIFAIMKMHYRQYSFSDVLQERQTSLNTLSEFN